MERQQQAPLKWQTRTGLVASGYRIVALVIGIAEMLANPSIMQVISQGDKNRLRGSLSILFICQKFLPQLLVNILLGVFKNVSLVISS